MDNLFITCSKFKISFRLDSFVSSRYGFSSKAALKTWSLIVNTFYSEPFNSSDRFNVFLYNRPKFGQRIKVKIVYFKNSISFFYLSTGSTRKPWIISLQDCYIFYLLLAAIHFLCMFKFKYCFFQVLQI